LKTPNTWRLSNADFAVVVSVASAQLGGTLLYAHREIKHVTTHRRKDVKRHLQNELPRLFNLAHGSTQRVFEQQHVETNHDLPLHRYISAAETQLVELRCDLVF
jgi:hypothetical protein